MTEGPPAWRPLPLEAVEPASLDLPGARGPILVLLASPATHASGWAVRAATEIARYRAGADARILLADLDLDRPRLHAELGGHNAEGISDAFLFGASLGRVARPTEDGFLFVPAGTAIADPARVLASRRWEAVTEGFEGAGAELFLFVPWDLPGRDAILERAGAAVLLAEREEVDVLDVEGLGIGAVLGPAVEPSEAAMDESVGPDAREAPEAAEPADAPPPAVDPSAPLSADELIPPEDDWAWEEEDGAPFESVAGGGTGTRRGLLFSLVVVVVLLIVVVLAALAGLVRIPGIPALFAGAAVEDTRPVEEPSGASVEDAEATPVAPGVGGDVSAPAAEGVGSLDRAMAVGSYRDLAEALERTRALAARDPTLVAAVSPVDVDGATWYRILLAPLPEGEPASVRTTLAERLGGIDASGWFERPTPLAFDLGDASSLQAGRARVALLADQGIPAYLVELRPPGASAPTYRVYAGAYSGPAEASHMRDLLRDRGFAGVPLVPRRGRAPGAGRPPA